MNHDWTLLSAFIRRHAHEPLAMVTLVSREGASYRQPGARMLVSARGERVGSLSGGCLEEGLAEVALRVLLTGEVRKERIDTRPHFGCPGVLEFLLERVEPRGLFECVLRKLQHRETFEVTTGPRGTVVGRAAGFVEKVGPAPRLLVVGWTSDQEPLFQLAAVLGWECHRLIRDARMEVPLVAEEHVRVGVADELIRHFPPDSMTAVLVMSHHLATDLGYLRAAFGAGYGYVGLLGSRRRRESLLAELGESGALDDERAIERFHAPAGLDLGAGHPATIALAILAEVQAVFAGHDGGFLRDRMGSIHRVVGA
ncbi:xanthine/CO dehydrogenase XdhC/CoxF family maturation factor [Haloferula luteola]|uniref:Xanthine/CO dehydrogenase XdhC/CoxF family maturation factor n=1 Tax=Haloferula luteola TaxID=595692 RepID=A0A840V4D8_9BACT|nr:XdhC family protein [Haloferula luteola]MBB5352413.1 xanthine/CO dehydrogenase XdhC/CoxF family maturation factor [Haloferula luteola]